MEQQPAVGEAADMESVEQFTYFMVRLESRAGDAGLEPRGLVERLGSGQKRSFARSGDASTRSRTRYSARIGRLQRAYRTSCFRRRQPPRR